MLKYLLPILMMAFCNESCALEPVVNTPTAQPDNKHKLLNEDMLYPTVMVMSGDIIGSGVIIKGRYVITAKHCVIDKNDTSISIVRGLIRQDFKASVVAVGSDDDPTADWAILKFSIPTPMMLSISENNIFKNGLEIFSAKLPDDLNNIDYGPFDEIYSVGFPMGLKYPRISLGTISPGDGTGGNHSAAIIMGNSGGPIFLKETHELIGINLKVMGMNFGFVNIPLTHTATFLPISVIAKEINDLK